jgi:hypothetical protein
MDFEHIFFDPDNPDGFERSMEEKQVPHEVRDKIRSWVKGMNRMMSTQEELDFLKAEAAKASYYQDAWISLSFNHLPYVRFVPKDDGIASAEFLINGCMVELSERDGVDQSTLQRLHAAWTRFQKALVALRDYEPIDVDKLFKA